MKKLTLSDLSGAADPSGAADASGAADLAGGAEGPVLAGAVPGFHIERGGITRYEAGSRSHPEGDHVHTVPEVFLILQGSGVIEIDGAPTPFQAGDVFVVEPGEDHHLLSQGSIPLLSAWMHLIPAGAGGSAGDA